MIITRPRGRREYVLEEERDFPENQQTKFLLDDLKEKDRVRIMDALQIQLIDGRAASEGLASASTSRARLD